MARRADRDHSDEVEQEEINEQEDSQLVADPTVRAKIIKKCHSKIRRLTGQVESLLEQAKPFKKDIAAEFRTLKSKTGLTRKEAEHVFWQADLEEDVRNDSMLRIREAFAAIGMGNLVSWNTAKDETRAEPAPKKNGNGHAASEDRTDAFNRGFDDVENGVTGDVPYKKGSKSYTEYLAGRSKALESANFETGSASH